MRVVVSRSGGGGGGDGRRRARRVICAHHHHRRRHQHHRLFFFKRKCVGVFLWDQIDFSDEERTFALLKKYQKILLLRMTMRKKERKRNRLDEEVRVPWNGRCVWKCFYRSVGTDDDQ